ncbi:MAG: TIGR02281 family clan AA aspartic protease [Gammaproteobacteria bacterium]|nr:TIGR02281 family clan AA aspartic protease [Gammaproteobacteria bacterium]
MNIRRTGQGMITASMIGGMALLTYFFSEFEDGKNNPNRSPETQVFANSIEVALQRNRQGHYLVGGQINKKEVIFLLDTGATDVVIPESTARALRLPYGRKGLAMTANGSITVHETRIRELQIGKIVLHDIKASINPGMSDGAILLGMSALSQIEFSQSGSTLTLRQKFI